jgi:hypothetical protein
MSTLLRAVSILIEDPSATGKVAEIHDKNVTFRPHHEYVDEETKITIDQLCAVRENMRRAAGAGQ